MSTRKYKSYNSSFNKLRNYLRDSNKLELCQKELDDLLTELRTTQNSASSAKEESKDILKDVSQLTVQTNVDTKQIIKKEESKKQNPKNSHQKDVSSVINLSQNHQEDEGLNFALLFVGLGDGFTEPEIEAEIKKPKKTAFNSSFRKRRKDRIQSIRL